MKDSDKGKTQVGTMGKSKENAHEVSGKLPRVVQTESGTEPGIENV